MSIPTMSCPSPGCKTTVQGRYNPHTGTHSFDELIHHQDQEHPDPNNPPNRAEHWKRKVIHGDGSHSYMQSLGDPNHEK